MLIGLFVAVQEYGTAIAAFAKAQNLPRDLTVAIGHSAGGTAMYVQLYALIVSQDRF